MRRRERRSPAGKNSLFARNRRKGGFFALFALVRLTAAKKEIILLYCYGIQTENGMREKAIQTAKRAGRILLAFFTGFAFFLAVMLCFMLIADAAADATMRWTPSYARRDLSPILAKETWSDEDYDVLYHQTGLSRTALDAMKGDSERILTFQEDFFYDGPTEHQAAAITTQHDRFANGYRAGIVDLEDGDVIVTSACHTYGWKNGHAAIVTDGATRTILQSVTLGVPSTIDYGGVNFFQRSPNFVVLRLKGADKETRAQIAATAAKRLFDIPYSVTVGFLSPKDQGVSPKATHCSHLVWQAYAYYGYDIDSDGGPVCTARDIVHSDLFEVVQVFGFDPDNIW